MTKNRARRVAIFVGQLTAECESKARKEGKSQMGKKKKKRGRRKIKAGRKRRENWDHLLTIR